MTTRALDLSTILHALFKMEDELFADCLDWNCEGELQEWIFSMLKEKRVQISALKDIDSKAVLEGISIAVISILDKTVYWRDGIAEPDNIWVQGKKYPAFKLKKSCGIFALEGFDKEPLIVIETKSGDLLCLMMTNEEIGGPDLVKKAFKILKAKRVSHPDYDWDPCAIIPKIDFKLSPEIDFMVGASKFCAGTSWQIVRAKQEFKFRMNEEGARAYVRTEMLLLGCCVCSRAKETQIVINRPFVGFFVQPGIDIPLAVFYADYDSWKDAGKLEDL